MFLGFAYVLVAFVHQPARNVVAPIVHRQNHLCLRLIRHRSHLENYSRYLCRKSTSVLLDAQLCVVVLHSKA